MIDVIILRDLALSLALLKSTYTYALVLSNVDDEAKPKKPLVFKAVVSTVEFLVAYAA